MSYDNPGDWMETPNAGTLRGVDPYAKYKELEAMTDIREHLYCDCSDPFHQLVFDYNDTDRELLIYYRMTPYMPWYKRLWVGFNYVIGRDIERIQYTEVVLIPNEHNGTIKTIRDMLNKVLGE